jgi:ribonuclease E
VDTLSLSLLRQISTQVAQGHIQEVRAAVPLEVSNFLLNKKRKEIHNLEEHYQLKIVVLPKEGLGPEEILVEYIKREAAEAKPGPEPKPAAEPQTLPEAQKAGGPPPAAAPKKTGRPRRGSGRSRKKPVPEPGKVDSAPEAAGDANLPEAQPISEPGAEAPTAAAPKKTGRPRRGSGRSRKKPASEPGKVDSAPEAAGETNLPGPDKPDSP